MLDALEGGGQTPSRRLFEAAKRVEADTGVSGLVPADRIFGLLEREFKARDIQESVAKALKPSESVDLSAHRTLLQLATGPDSKVRLVTTNFDLLFESAEPGLNSYNARGRKSPREELTGSTITVSNLGKLGGVASTPVINAPEIAIIGVNNARERPLVQHGAIVVRRMMNLSSSFDHRFVDGFDAAAMIQALKSTLEHPATIFI